MSVGCPDCGTLQELEPPPRRALAACAGCGNVLERTAGRSVDAALALSASVLLLYVAAHLLPFMRVSLAGAERETRIGQVLPYLAERDWLLVALALAGFILVLPLARYGLLVATLGCLRSGRRPRWLGRSFRWACVLEPWSMPDVLLIGAIIGYTRLTRHLQVEIGAGGWCLVAAAGLAMVTEASLDRRAVWRALGPSTPWPLEGGALSCTACELVAPAAAEGSDCPRCGARLSLRKRDALARTAALALAAFALYPAANFWPMTTVTRLGETQGQTILFAVVELVKAGLLPLALIIFCASFAIPLLKLVALGWCLLSVRFGWRRGLLFRTRLYRLLEAVGRWSNLDVMIIAVFVPLMQFGEIVTARFGLGAAFFFAVVILTMLATRTFDPRLMWDAAERRR